MVMDNHSRSLRPRLLGTLLPHLFLASLTASVLVACPRENPASPVAPPVTASASVPDSPPPPKPTSALPEGPLVPQFELTAALPWATPGLEDLVSKPPASPGTKHWRAPRIRAYVDGSIWMSVKPTEVVVAQGGAARRLSFTGAGLEWYLDHAALADGGVLVLGWAGGKPMLVRLDANGAVVTKSDLPAPDAGAPLVAYALKENGGTFEIHLWSQAESALRRIQTSDLSLGPPVPLQTSVAQTQWAIDRDTAYWIERDAADPNVLFARAVSLRGGDTHAVRLDPTIPESPYDKHAPAGRDLRNDLRLSHGRLADGSLVTAATSLVWIRPNGSAALSVPFEQVIRADDGVAVAVPNAGSMGRIGRVERWAAGHIVASVAPELHDGSFFRLVSASANGFDVLAEHPRACVPRDKGLPSVIEHFAWTSARSAGQSSGGCARDGEGARDGHADALLATVAPDGSVLVPGADREGVFIVRVRAVARP
ncbi:Hypothetical protein A7982_10094 [Minicystis rosea]|nr:Hypothetical protein A7982_10094 [Minicystis rosea]